MAFNRLAPEDFVISSDSITVIEIQNKIEEIIKGYRK